MKLLLLNFEEATQNLAFEEWYFNRFKEDTLRLWINPASVVVGKHQNAYAEVNFAFCSGHGIPVIRRISGGGTVFHDQGNINFSFFRLVERSNPIQYAHHLAIVRKALLRLGYKVDENERHDLILNGKKISGNAQHVSRGRALHHGTLLYNADLPSLRRGITRTGGIYSDRAIKSIRSPVANMRATLDLGETREFLLALAQKFELDLLKLNRLDWPSELATLLAERYENPSWNFGYGPPYAFENRYGEWSVQMKVQREGTIESGTLERVGTAENASLSGIKHTQVAIEGFLMKMGIDISRQEALNLFF